MEEVDPLVGQRPENARIRGGGASDTSLQTRALETLSLPGTLAPPAGSPSPLSPVRRLGRRAAAEGTLESLLFPQERLPHNPQSPGPEEPGGRGSGGSAPVPGADEVLSLPLSRRERPPSPGWAPWAFPCKVRSSDSAQARGSSQPLGPLSEQAEKQPGSTAAPWLTLGMREAGVLRGLCTGPPAPTLQFPALDRGAGSGRGELTRGAASTSCPGSPFLGRRPFCRGAPPDAVALPRGRGGEVPAKPGNGLELHAG